MAEKVVPKQAPAFEFMLFEGDADHMRTVIATPNEASPWIDPTTLKLRHRIGRGSFGDVWLATHHQSAEDFDEYHEVAIKMLNLVKEGNLKIIMDRFREIFFKCQALDSVCWLHGISIVHGKISIIMKFYEGSIGDKMARLREGKLSLSDILRYGSNLAKAIMEMHSQEIIVLNLKPTNFLLDENDRAILGDVGIAHLLLGISLSNSDTIHRLGTPNYMAPEQWEPEVRGPISIETDSWGFGCSILEMWTGVHPWSGRSIQQIHHSVVVDQEKPHIPNGLPPEIENVLAGCFEYDFRNRPLMDDILRAFKSAQDVSLTGAPFTVLGMDSGRGIHHGYTEWFLTKDHLREGDVVRSRKTPNSCKPESMVIPEGKIVGLERNDSRDGFVLVRVHRIHDPLRIHASTLERVTHGFAAGDWVRLKEEERKHSSVGILHSIHRDGRVAVGFIGLETLWKGKFFELQMAEAYCVGQFVRLKSDVFNPRFDWPGKRGGPQATGKIIRIHPNGCLVVKFPGRFSLREKHGAFLADPAQVEVVSFSTCPGVVQKYQHLEDFHWAVRPLLVALGLFTAMKLGLFIGRKMGKSKMKKGQRTTTPREGQQVDGAGNSAWLPSVATIIRR
ncbi:hypothetical protein Nepgr_000834 [Nepenthes gracilis]|uniref:Protein kinase domain-containing protein n=1 Tax=Nepenthes gracilis TaxID=150966 RepID=A0AAD3P248_NEPGR|nr:hypothetical protein Nepgr_000834 [Nepenthes gracilis]